MNSLKIKKHTFSVLFALFIFYFLFLVSGYRVGGYDYDNYIDMITFSQSGETLFGKIILAKDPMFGLIVGIINPSELSEYGDVFLFIAGLAFLGKLFFICDLHRCISFALFYLVLLSPSLDFAAIRALLGVVILLAALSSLSKSRYKRYCLFSMLSLLSHVSMLLPLALSSNLTISLYNKNKVFFCCFLFVTSVSMKPILNLFSNTSGYIGVSGSVFAFFPPVLMLVSMYLIGLVMKLQVQTDFCSRCFNLAFLINIMSLGFTFQVVVASSRFLQVSQVLFLVVLCSIRFKKSIYNLLLLFSAGFGFAVPLLYQNYNFDLWHSAWNSINVL